MSLAIPFIILIVANKPARWVSNRQQYAGFTH